MLEYAAPVWHHLITKAHTEQIEAVQRRAIRIIYSYTCDMPYINALYVADIPSLVDRSEQLSRVFKSILQPSSCLFHTVPPARDLATVRRLRAASKFPRIPTRTKNTSHSFPLLSLVTRLHSP